MRSGVLLRALSALCVGLMLTFLAGEVDAQRRGGGGRGRGGGGRMGGGRSVQRTGPAMGGTMRPSRGGGAGAMGSRTARPATPTTRPATPTTRPATPSRPGAGAGTGTAAGGTRPQRPGTGERPGQGDRPGGDRENREDWQNWANERQDDRQKYANNAREDRQDFYEENGGAYYYGGGWGYGHGHYTVIDYSENNDWAVLMAGIVVGTTLTAAAFSSMQSSTACSLSEVTVNGVRYYRCGKNWYTRVMDGSNVNYVVVSPPAGY